jgi:hypothetical protein
VKKTLFLSQSVLFVASALLAILLLFACGCSKQTKLSNPIEQVEKPFTIDSVSLVSKFLVIPIQHHSIYSVIECSKISSDSIRCFAFNSNTQTFDTLKGYFNTARAFEITNSSKTVTIRASFRENGFGRGVLSTPSTAIHLEFRLTPFINDSIFVGGIDSIFSTINSSNNIEYQLTFPTFKHQSVNKNVIFSSMIKNSQSFFQTYVDSLNPKEFHFLKYKAICKKIDNNIWNYEWFLESDLQKGIPLFELSFQESNAKSISTNSMENLLKKYNENDNNAISTLISLQKDSIPNSKYVGVSNKGISIYYPHKKKMFYPFNNPSTRKDIDSVSIQTNKNPLKKHTTK